MVPLKPTILLVEDVESMRALLAMMLERRGCEVLAAATGEQALSIWKQSSKIDVLVTDLALGAAPNGDVLAKRCRQDCADLPVIYASGIPYETASNKFDLVSPAIFLAKPISTDQLMGAIKSALES